MNRACSEGSSPNVSSPGGRRGVRLGRRGIYEVSRLARHGAPPEPETDIQGCTFGVETCGFVVPLGGRFRHCQIEARDGVGLVSVDEDHLDRHRWEVALEAFDIVH